MSHPIIRTSQDFAAQPFGVSGPCTIAEPQAGEPAQPSASGQPHGCSTVEFFVLLLSIAAGADAGHAS
jgi:hypothetical protein